ncbi:sigma-54-dependent transcriptional regulator [Desulfobulbus oligotrophicus]|uniref:Sigma-54-dependent Fis family transcriptional regulator n=1 Tax=Desulfobulbus oligotrophicus TaxID=1909699 RepID=A0A7T5VF93_9BACT|nr:sigma-54 dependent transcriptional regulator [Desulfobulbus oligotrophicus]QQG66835.1 sigma-54-dependent Fis family transcriptional regulator [Desulfobulbus oligotrophicus]
MHILIVDDEQLQRNLLAGFLVKQGYTITEAATGEEAIHAFRHLPIDLVLLDHRLPDLHGDAVLAELKRINPLVRVIMITAYGAVDTAVRVMQLGADDFLEKPVDLTHLLKQIQTIEEGLYIARDVAQVEKVINTTDLPVRIVAASPAMQQVISLVMRAAPSPWTVLIQGETGTGKELIARLLHLLSPRKAGPFIPLNCAAVPEGLFESELFGHEKGAFTGAVSRRRGVFEQAHQGTLLLDEVGELPMMVQAKLLRALQEKSIQRVGGEQFVPVDVRVLAATNRDLKQMTTDGTFREDLYFRLNVIAIDLPPLRQRKEDIPALTHFFLNKYHSKAVIDDQAMGQLTKYAFPGNIRELEHILQRTITFARSPVISLRDLPAEVRTFQNQTIEGDLNTRLSEVERQMLIEALERSNWVQTRAAESLGISERVLRYKMEKLNIAKKR